MDTDAFSSAIDSLKAVYTVLLALSLGEAFSELVDKEAGGGHRKIIINRILNLVPFLLLIIPFIQGMDRYFFQVYKTAPRPYPYGDSLLLDCSAFTLEGICFFILARSLSVERWRRFYITVMILLAVDAVWGLIVLHLHIATVKTWVLLDVFTLIPILMVVIVAASLECAKTLSESTCKWLVSCLGALIIVARTVIDYVNSWDFYFPKP